MVSVVVVINISQLMFLTRTDINYKKTKNNRTQNSQNNSSTTSGQSYYNIHYKTGLLLVKRKLKHLHVRDVDAVVEFIVPWVGLDEEEGDAPMHVSFFVWAGNKLLSEKYY